MDLSKGRLRFTAGGQPVEALDLPDGFRSSVAWLVDLCDTWCEKARPKETPAPKPADVEAIVEPDGVRIVTTASTTSETGVEMEALTAASVAALTVYDMMKALDKSIEIRDVYLLEKTGGKSGDWRRDS